MLAALLVARRSFSPPPWLQGRGGLEILKFPSRGGSQSQCFCWGGLPSRGGYPYLGVGSDNFQLYFYFF